MNKEIKRIFRFFSCRNEKREEDEVNKLISLQAIWRMKRNLIDWNINLQLFFLSLTRRWKHFYSSPSKSILNFSTFVRRFWEVLLHSKIKRLSSFIHQKTSWMSLSVVLFAVAHINCLIDLFPYIKTFLLTFVSLLTSFVYCTSHYTDHWWYHSKVQ